MRSQLTKRNLIALVATLGVAWAWSERVRKTTAEEDLSIRDVRSDATAEATWRDPLPGSHTGTENSAATVLSPNQEQNPSEPLAKAQSLIDKGSTEEGAALLEELVKREPHNTQAMMELAMVYTLDFKSPAKARAMLERILDINPNHRAALNELELIYNELGAQEEGLALMALKAEQNPDAKELQFTYGRMLSSTDPGAAIPWLTKGTEIPDIREQAFNDLAFAALKAGKVQLAIDSLRQSLKIAETELELAKAEGRSGIDFLEDRIAATRSEISKAEAQMSRQ